MKSFTATALLATAVIANEGYYCGSHLSYWAYDTDIGTYSDAQSCKDAFEASHTFSSS